jgi:hypothetical protein
MLRYLHCTWVKVNLSPMRALARISDFKYDNSTDSIIFAITYHTPSGGPLDLKIPRVSEKQSVSVIMDGKLVNQASIKMNGKTVSINLSCKNHQ